MLRGDDHTGSAREFRFRGVKGKDYVVISESGEGSPQTAGTATLTVANGTIIADQRVGLRDRNTAIITGSVSIDRDGNGVPDAGGALAGWMVFIDNDNDGILDAGEHSMEHANESRRYR